jgi:hypothetical protein
MCIVVLKQSIVTEIGLQMYPVPARKSIRGDTWIPIIPSMPAPPPHPDQPTIFQEFLEQLAPWESQLFPTLHMEVDCYEFLDLVNSQIIGDTALHLITVSDGSKDSGSMTFGWVIALLVRCSKVVAFLSVSRFLVRLQEFCSTTGNNGLLMQLKTSLPSVDPFPNTTLIAGWNMTNEIVQSLRQLPIPPVLEHVKGNQDDHLPYGALPLEEQLNVDADAKAGCYQCMFPAQRPKIPRLPSNPAQLHLSGQVICSKLKSRIREAFTVPAYIQYLVN